MGGKMKNVNENYKEDEIKEIILRELNNKKRYSEIAIILNEMGYLTKKGSNFRSSTVGKLFTRELETENEVKITQIYEDLTEESKTLWNMNEEVSILQEKEQTTIKDLIGKNWDKHLRQEVILNKQEAELRELETEGIKKLENECEIKTIEFYNSELECLRDLKTDIKYFVPRKICKLMEINWSAQYKRIMRDPGLRSCVSIMETQVFKPETQKRRIIILPLKKLSIFLYGINANMCENKEIARIIETFKEEVEEILHTAFTQKTKNSLEIMRDMVDKLIEHDSRLEKLELKIETMITNKNLALEQIKELPPATVEIKTKTRNLINKYVRSFVQVTGLETDEEYKATWKSLKNGFKYATLHDGKQHNFELIAENKTKKNIENGTNKEVSFLDAVEEAGFIEDLYAYCKKIFILTETISTN